MHSAAVIHWLFCYIQVSKKKLTALCSSLYHYAKYKNHMSTVPDGCFHFQSSHSHHTRSTDIKNRKLQWDGLWEFT
jgi:hypothetical protein